MKFTRGAALMLTAVGSLAFYAIATWMFIADLDVAGWVSIVTGFFGWVVFLAAVTADMNAAKAGGGGG